MGVDLSTSKISEAEHNLQTFCQQFQDLYGWLITYTLCLWLEHPYITRASKLHHECAPCPTFGTIHTALWTPVDTAVFGLKPEWTAFTPLAWDTPCVTTGTCLGTYKYVHVHSIQKQLQILYSHPTSIQRCKCSDPCPSLIWKAASHSTTRNLQWPPFGQQKSRYTHQAVLAQLKK